MARSNNIIIPRGKHTCRALGYESYENPRGRVRNQGGGGTEKRRFQRREITKMISVRILGQGPFDLEGGTMGFLKPPEGSMIDNLAR